MKPKKWSVRSQLKKKNIGIFRSFFRSSEFSELIPTWKIHFCLWDHFLRIQEIFEESFVGPLDSGALVGRGVNISGYGTGSTAKETIKVRTLLGSSTLKRRSEKRGSKKIVKQEKKKKSEVRKKKIDVWSKVIG